MQPALKGTGRTRGAMEHPAPLAPQPVPQPPWVPLSLRGIATTSNVGRSRTLGAVAVMAAQAKG